MMRSVADYGDPGHASSKCRWSLTPYFDEIDRPRSAHRSQQRSRLRTHFRGPEVFRHPPFTQRTVPAEQRSVWLPDWLRSRWSPPRAGPPPGPFDWRADSLVSFVYLFVQLLAIDGEVLPRQLGGIRQGRLNLIGVGWIHDEDDPRTSGIQGLTDRLEVL
jgi:hypothetical protein